MNSSRDLQRHFAVVRMVAGDGVEALAEQQVGALESRHRIVGQVFNLAA
jgi:hypothetical protein